MGLLKKALSFFKNSHFQSLLGTGFNSFIGFVIYAMIFRAIPIVDVGYYVLFTIVLNLIDTVKAGFLTTAFVNFFAGVDEHRAREVAGSSWGLGLIITGGLVICNIGLYFAIPYVSDPAIVLVFKYFAIVSIVTMPAFMATIVVQAEKRFDRLLVLRLITQLSFLAAIVTLMITGQATLNTIIYAYIGSNLLASVVTLMFGWTRFNNLKYATKKAINEIFHFGKYSFGTSISSNLFSVTDNFFISVYLGPAYTAIYSLGGKLIQIVEIPLLSFTMSTMPNMAAYYNKEYKYNVIFVMKKMIGMLTIPLVFIAIFSIIFAGPIIAIIGGQRFVHTEAPNVFRIFMTLAILYPADRFSAVALDVINKPQVNFYKIIVMLTLNLVADYIGVTVFKSVYSIAITNILPLLAAIIMAYVPLNKYYAFNFWSIYSVGYQELMTLIKSTYANLKGRHPAEEV